MKNTIQSMHQLKTLMPVGELETSNTISKWLFLGTNSIQSPKSLVNSLPGILESKECKNQFSVYSSCVSNSIIDLTVIDLDFQRVYQGSIIYNYSDVSYLRYFADKTIQSILEHQKYIYNFQTIRNVGEKAYFKMSLTKRILLWIARKFRLKRFLND